MQRPLIIALLMFFMTSFFVGDSFAHSGGTNAAGCHTNRSTGDYHCHNSKPIQSDRQNYCHVINGERRCGYALSSCQSLQRQFGGYCQTE